MIVSHKQAIQNITACASISIFLLLHWLMDPRLYIYELRRPRVSNPTFNSSLVNTSCFSLYSGGPLTSSESNLNPQTNRSQAYSQSKDNIKEELTRSRGSSNLSNIGSNTLKLQDRDIYKKQANKFDIISMQPVEHQETIKKYPKFTLEDKDAYYFRKVVKADIPQYQPQNIAARHEEIAGKQLYQVDKNKLALNMWESYAGVPAKKHQHFTPGMLNHVDEFRSIM